MALKANGIMGEFLSGVQEELNAQAFFADAVENGASNAVQEATLNIAEDASQEAVAQETQSSFQYGQKILGQMAKRGWTDTMIDEAITNPLKTAATTNLATGIRCNGTLW